MSEEKDKRHMIEAIRLARKALEEGGAPFGALIVDSDIDEIVCVGNNHSSVDCIWHGEIDAVHELSKVAEKENESVYSLCAKRNFELYTTAEPCPMCMGGIMWAGIQKVTYGTSIEALIGYGWRQINVPCSTIAEATHPRKEGFQLRGGFVEEETNKLYEVVPDWAKAVQG